MTVSADEVIFFESHETNPAMGDEAAIAASDAMLAFFKNSLLSQCVFILSDA